MSRIILADDDDIFSDIVVDTLMNVGHVVGRCSNGIETLSALKFRAPQLLILDCNMPGMSGIEVLRQMRADKTLFCIPVLMLTARTSLSDERIARFDGAHDYLTKPVVTDELLCRVESLLSRPVSNVSLKDYYAPSDTALGSGKRMSV